MVATVNPGSAEPEYALLLQTVQIQIWTCTVCHYVCEFVSTTWIDYSDWLKIRSGRPHCILIYSAWKGLIVFFFRNRFWNFYILILICT